MTLEESARDFFEVCETSGGWEASKGYCHDGTSFACQADALADTTSIEGYAEWMNGVLGPIPDGCYELTAFAADAERGTVVASAIIHGTQAVPRGSGEPTGKAVASDYA